MIFPADFPCSMVGPRGKNVNMHRVSCLAAGLVCPWVFFPRLMWFPSTDVVSLSLFDLGNPPWLDERRAMWYKWVREVHPLHPSLAAEKLENKKSRPAHGTFRPARHSTTEQKPHGNPTEKEDQDPCCP